MKKFITIALAVAVLFSFAACQPTYKTVIGMSATTDKTNYLVGQSIDLSSVDVTVRYSDGSSDAFTGEDVTYMGPAKFTLTDAAAASTTGLSQQHSHIVTYIKADGPGRKPCPPALMYAWV